MWSPADSLFVGFRGCGADVQYFYTLPAANRGLVTVNSCPGGVNELTVSPRIAGPVQPNDRCTKPGGFHVVREKTGRKV